jgi:hypothetical protein
MHRGLSAKNNGKLKESVWTILFILCSEKSILWQLIKNYNTVELQEVKEVSNSRSKGAVLPLGNFVFPRGKDEI